MKDKISIVIPVYRVEAYLRKCLDSVIEQSYDNLEIILVDDGSPDGSAAICEEYAAQDRRIQVVHQENQGLSVARNTGTKYATGEYLLYLDSDDYLDKDYCNTIWRAAKETDSDIVVGEIVTVDEEGVAIDSSLGLVIPERKIWNNQEAMREVVVEQQIRGYAWGKLYKRELVEGITFPAGKAYEDRFTVHKYFGKANKVCICPGAITYYRLRPASITHSPNLDKWYDLLEGEEKLLQFCHQYYPELVNNMESKYVGRYVHIWIHFFDSGKKMERKKLETKMRQIYSQYGRKSYIKRMHKLSYQMIFAVPSLYRWLIHVTNFDKNER